MYTSCICFIFGNRGNYRNMITSKILNFSSKISTDSLPLFYSFSYIYFPLLRNHFKSLENSLSLSNSIYLSLSKAISSKLKGSSIMGKKSSVSARKKGAKSKSPSKLPLSSTKPSTRVQVKKTTLLHHYFRKSHLYCPNSNRHYSLVTTSSTTKSASTTTTTHFHHLICH